MDRLEKEFQYVRKTFFPRWDRRREWRVEFVSDLDGCEGVSDDAAKVIRTGVLVSGDELTALLIHETAHAATFSRHSKRWQERMLKAAQKAEAVGRQSLANLLRKEVEVYRTRVFKPFAAVIYNMIGDAVLECPDVTFSQVIEFVRRDIGLSAQEFLSQYRRASKVFDQAKENVKR